MYFIADYHALTFLHDRKRLNQYIYEVAIITGLDGRKMSKSYGNTIDIFAPSKQLRKQVMKIKTDSKQPEDIKDPDTCNVFAIYKHFASDECLREVRQQYLQGGLAYGEIKQKLFELLDGYFEQPRTVYNQLLADTAHLDTILANGAARAREIARPTMASIREAIGIGVTGRKTA